MSDVDFYDRRLFDLAYAEGSVGLLVDDETRAALRAILLELWEGKATHGQMKKALRPLVENTSWEWPEAVVAMRQQGERVAEARDPVEQAVFLSEEIMMRAHHHARRGQINATLAGSLWAYKGIQVDACLNTSKKTAPCGWRDREKLKINDETLARIPPCKILGCRCAWLLIGD